VMESYYSLDFEKDLAILSFIWVKPEERRQGVGRRLFRQALDEATEIKKRFGHIPKHESLTWTSEEYLYAHPIALKYEFKYLEDVGRTDVIERRKMMISAAQKLLTKEGGEM